MTKYLGKSTTIAGAAVGTIGQIKSISGYNPTVDSIDVTVHSATYHRDFAAGLRNGGTMDIEVFYDFTDAGTKGCIDLLHGDPSLNTDTFTITLPDTKTIIFGVVVTGVNLGIPLDDFMTATISIQITGAVTGTLLA
jgi:hypothetical protein